MFIFWKNSVLIRWPKMVLFGRKWSFFNSIWSQWPKMIIFDRKCSFLKTYPESFWGLRFWYSTSSTVQTAPLTFSTRTKHLCNDKLWRTAFFQVAAFFLKFFRKKSLLNNFEIFENFIGRVNDDSPEICKSLHKIIVYLVQSQLFIIGFNDCLKNIF